jgi:hypothetical protein
MTVPAAVPDEDEFFIGWLPVPRSYVRLLRPVAVVLLLVAGAAAILVALLQHNPGPGQWDDDSTRTFEGIVTAQPYAMLRTAGEASGGSLRTYLLVEEGKFGAGPRVEQLLQGQTQQAARATGTILHRDGRWMIELTAGEEGLKPLAEGGKISPVLNRPRPQVLADRANFSGEIIDPKCYLGAMKPASGKTHKACASLCISGGIPPMLVTRDGKGQLTYYLLTTANGEAANETVLPFVGDPVEATGRIVRQGDLLLFNLAADGIQRR